MRLRSIWTRVKYGFALAGAVGAAGTAFGFPACTGTKTAVVPATTDSFLYTSYYPADVAVSGVYWAGPWAYDALYVLANGGVGIDGGGVGPGNGVPTVPSAPTTTAPSTVTTPGDAIRALARGQSLCPSQVTVTPKMAAPPCTGAALQRSGVTLVFSGCQTPGGGTISGTVDVTTTRTASTAVCDATTSVTLTHTTTITNLDYTGISGGRLFVPSQTDTGTNVYTFGQTPSHVSVSSTGQLQIFARDGSQTSDHTFTGTATFSFGGSETGYTVDGNVAITDNRTAGQATAATVTGLERIVSCCRPVGGSVILVQTSGPSPGTRVWAFGPSCGDLTVDGQDASLPLCI
jgi:hypothetical protein